MFYCCCVKDDAPAVDVVEVKNSASKMKDGVQAEESKADNEGPHVIRLEDLEDEDKTHIYTWMVELPKCEAGKLLGVEFGIKNKGLLVVQMHPDRTGVLSRWCDQNPGFALRPGDLILQVNNLTMETHDPARMIKELKAVTLLGKPLSLKVMRVTQYTLSIEKQGPLRVNIREDNLEVIDIKRGPVEDYNVNNEGDTVVAPGDTLIEVNGVSGTNAEIFREVKSAEGQVRMVFQRTLLEGVC